MKHLLFFILLTANLAHAAQDEHKFLFAGQESEAFTLKGEIWSKGDGPQTEYCHDGGTRYEEQCGNHTRTRRACETGPTGQTEHCWEESYDEYSCEQIPVSWGSIEPCGTSNEDSFRIAVTAPVTVSFPKNGPKDGIDFTATFEEKNIFKLTPGLLPTGMIATVAVTTNRVPQTKPVELTEAVHFDVQFRTMKDFLADTAKGILGARMDRENRRLYLTIDGVLNSTDALVLKVNAKTGYHHSRMDVLELSGKPSGEFVVRNQEDKKLLSRLSRDQRGKLMLEIDMNPAWDLLTEALKKSPSVETTVTKVLDPGVEWLGVTSDLKQVFTVPVK